jgi:hypothetical protein
MILFWRSQPFIRNTKIIKSSGHCISFLCFFLFFYSSEPTAPQIRQLTTGNRLPHEISKNRLLLISCLFSLDLTPLSFKLGCSLSPSSLFCTINFASRWTILLDQSSSSMWAETIFSIPRACIVLASVCFLFIFSFRGNNQGQALY